MKIKLNNLFNKEDLSSDAKLVYVIISMHDRLYLYRETLLKKSGLSVKACRKALDELKSKELLEIIKQRNGRSWWYRYILKDVESL